MGIRSPTEMCTPAKTALLINRAFGVPILRRSPTRINPRKKASSIMGTQTTIETKLKGIMKPAPSSSLGMAGGSSDSMIGEQDGFGGRNIVV